MNHVVVVPGAEMMIVTESLPEVLGEVEIVTEMKEVIHGGIEVHHPIVIEVGMHGEVRLEMNKMIGGEGQAIVT